MADRGTRGWCVGCGAPLTDSRCPACGLDDQGPMAAQLRAVDQEIAALERRRAALRAAIRPDPAPDAGPAPPPPPRPSLLPPPPASWLPPPPADRAAPMVPAGPSLAAVLSTAGTGLLVVAALVFAVVSWDRLGAVGQAALLVAVTAGAGLGTWAAARRGLTTTAEALGVLTVVVAPAVAQVARVATGLVGDDRSRTWGNWDRWSFWPVALLAVGAAAWAFGRVVRVRSPQVLAVGILQVGVPLWVAWAPLPAVAQVLILAAQAVVAAGGVAWWHRRDWTGPGWWVGGGLVWLAAAIRAAGAMGDGGWPSPVALVVAAAAAGAVFVRWRAEPLRAAATAWAATAAGVMAAGLVAHELGGPPAVWPVVGLVGVGLLALARPIPAFRGPGTAAVGTASVLVVEVAMRVADAASDWHRDGGPRPLTHRLVVGGGWGLVIGFVVVLAVMVAAVAVDGRRWSRSVPAAVLTGAGAAGFLLLPPLAGAPNGGVLAAALLVVAATGLAPMVGLGAAPIDPGIDDPLGSSPAWAEGGPATDPLTGAVVAAGLVGLVAAFGWASPSTALTAVVVTLVGVVAAVRFVAALRSTADPAPGDPTDPGGPSTGWPGPLLVALVAGFVDVGLVARLAGLPLGPALAAVAVAGVVLAAAVPRARGVRRAAAVEVAVGVGFTVHVAAGLLAVDAFTVSTRVAGLTAMAAIGAAGAAVAAFRAPSWGWRLGWLATAGAEAVVVSWIQLADRSVGVIEAYTVPLALVLLTVAASVPGRTPGTPRPSWSLEGPALAVLLVPSALVTLGDPGLTRMAVVLAGGAGALAAGAAWRRRAPVDVGAAVVAVVGIYALAPYVATVPRWILLAVVGAALVALGATFERRRDDAAHLRRSYGRLR